MVDIALLVNCVPGALLTVCSDSLTQLTRLPGSFSVTWIVLEPATRPRLLLQAPIHYRWFRWVGVDVFWRL